MLRPKGYENKALTGDEDKVVGVEGMDGALRYLAHCLNEHPELLKEEDEEASDADWRDTQRLLYQDSLDDDERSGLNEDIDPL